MRGVPFPLFVLTIEALKRKQGEGGYILAVKVSGGGGEGVGVSYHLFFDDTLIFYKVSQEQVLYLS